MHRFATFHLFSIWHSIFSHTLRISNLSSRFISSLFLLLFLSPVFIVYKLSINSMRLKFFRTQTERKLDHVSGLTIYRKKDLGYRSMYISKSLDMILNKHLCRYILKKRAMRCSLPLPFKIKYFFLLFCFSFLPSLPMDTHFTLHSHACFNRTAISFARQADRCLSKLPSRDVTGLIH